MKHFLILVLLVALGTGLFSCTPQSLENVTQETQACCGDGDIQPPTPPPPPPPPGDGD